MFFDINDLGQAVGMSECQGSLVGCSPWFQAQAILYQNGTVTVLDPLIEGPRGRSGFCTYAIGVNNNGQILIEGQSAAGGAFLLTPPWMAGDVNADCRVNAHDITLLLENWGPVGQGTVRRADVDEDGEVGGMDLGLLLGGWTGE